MPPNETASFTDEDRARADANLRGLLNTHGSDRPILESEHAKSLRILLAYITYLEGAVARADELEASLGPLFDALVIDEEAPCGWFPSETEQILTHNAARAYRSARAALPTSKED